MDDTSFVSEIELDGLPPDETFAILGNEMRLDIIRVLWSAGAMREFDEVDDTETEISFSELQRAVDIRDNGRFNYHLSKLVPHFVRRTEGGYRLSSPGKKIARAVVTISGERPTVSDELESSCPICDSPLVATYDEQWLRFTCTGCDGLFGDTAPDGAIYYASYPAAGLSGRPLDETLSTGLYRCMLDLTYLMRDICRECAGPISASVSICQEHDVDDTPSCETCGTPFEVWTELRCTTCRFAKRLPVELCVMGLTPVIVTLADRGIDVLSPSFGELVHVIRTQFRTHVTRGPVRVIVTIEDETDDLTLTFDEEMSLVDRTP